MKDHVVHEKPANALQEMKLWIVLSPKSLNTQMALVRSRAAFVSVRLLSPSALTWVDAKWKVLQRHAKTITCTFNRFIFQ